MRNGKPIQSLVMLLLCAVCLWAGGATVLAQAPPAAIHGKVVYPDGSPAAGIELGLYPWREDLDLTNAFYKIPNYDYHKTKTDANGDFVMTNVIDYPENTGHRYCFFVTGPTKFYHATTHLVLGQMTEFKAVIHLSKASVIRLTLKGLDGKPYNGKRAIYVQTGVLGQGVSNGVSYIVDVNFVNGVGEWGPVVLKDQVTFKGRVAVLDFPNADYAHSAMKERGMPMGDTEAPLRWAMKDARGKALDRSLSFVPSGYTEIELAL